MTLKSLISRFRRTHKERARGTRWKISGCCEAGLVHLRHGRSCEDSAGWILRDKTLAIAVADGAGTAAKPNWGSAVAVRTALTWLWDFQCAGKGLSPVNAKDILTQMCQATLNSICLTAAELEAQPRDLATTLIVVISDGEFCAVVHAGDGAVVIEGVNGDVVTLTTPANGEYANETLLLGPCPEIEVKINSLCSFPIKSIAVLSDGLQRVALQLPSGDPYEPFFVPMFDRNRKLNQPEMENFLRNFLTSPRVNARCDDDKSLVLATLV